MCGGGVGVDYCGGEDCCRDPVPSCWEETGHSEVGVALYLGT